ncbi:MAG: aminotransferase class V-fold PLP-dependent enzyme [Chloroflexi bacterium]|nr:aminotransferase class V-fold PLP-dependent enzyme [Chloroflexota bacterium]
MAGNTPLPSQKTLDDLKKAFAEFQQAYPTFDAESLAALRAKEYARLDELGHIYLDYTGGGLYAESQLAEHMNILRGGVYGNPHSNNPTSVAATRLDEHARAYVLEYFNADPEEYTVVFTQNASGALKLVGEAYPFEAGGRYLLTFDNHNSVNGIREFARAKGATFTYAPVLPPELRMDERRLNELLDQAQPGQNNLFAYPAQSNFSGVQHSLEWIEKAQAKGWDVLLDAAAYSPTNSLDLSRWHPDFVSLSFYKICGYPTGVGCLLARRTALRKLHRPWFAGGTITIASVQGDGYYLQDGEAAFEDGTINYLNLPAVEIGLRYMASVGIDTIHERVITLTDWLLDHLLELHHSNGAPVIYLYGPASTQQRGSTVTINFFDPSGKLFDYRQVELQANTVNISLRTGCFCNPGAGEQAHGLTAEDLSDCFHRGERMSFEEFIKVMSGRVKDAVGAVRVSLGIATNFADVYHFVQFAKTFIDRTA